MADISPERRAQLQKERQSCDSNSNFYQTKNLTQDKIRLTPIGDKDDVGYKVVSYFINKTRIVCPEETTLHGTPGVIAKARRALERIGTPKALEFAEVLKKARRCKWVMKIISRMNPKQVLWFEAPKAVYQVALDAMLNDGEDITHSQEGRDIRISKTGTGMATEYNCRLLDKSPLADTKEERIAIKNAAKEKNIADLVKLNEEKAVEALKAVIPRDLWSQISKEVAGTVDDEEDDAQPASKVVDDEDEDAAPKKAAEKPVATKAGRGVVVEDDEDDAPKASAKKTHVVEDDDDLDDAPKTVTTPKSGKSAAQTVDDEDDE